MKMKLWSKINIFNKKATIYGASQNARLPWIYGSRRDDSLRVGVGPWIRGVLAACWLIRGGRRGSRLKLQSAIHACKIGVLGRVLLGITRIWGAVGCA